jgi:hypothetical protein
MSAKKEKQEQTKTSAPPGNGKCNASDSPFCEQNGQSGKQQKQQQ